MVNQRITFLDALNNADVSASRYRLPFIAGMDNDNHVVIKDLADLQHLLIAGASGSGKSTLGHEVILSLIQHASPDEVRLVLCDTKMVEYSCYNNTPHLLVPVTSAQEKIDGIINWMVTETYRRLSMISQTGARSFEQYNEKMLRENHPVLTNIVVLIDDAADAVDTNDQMDSLISLTMNSRAAGIHLILITQNPSCKRIAEIVKTAIPNRASFFLISSTEKRLLFGTSSGEFPTETGDMLFTNAIEKKREKVHGFIITDSIIQAVTKEACQKYAVPVLQEIPINRYTDPEHSSEELEGDDLLPAAMDVILETGLASVSTIQRRLKLGYARAARIIDEMEEKGLVGPFQGSRPRQILITKEEWEQQNGKCKAAGQSVFNLSVFKELIPSDLETLIKETDGSSASTKQELDDFLSHNTLVRSFQTRVVGVSYDNDDGSSRQDILSHCLRGEPVGFYWHTFNGAPACAVISDRGQIGYLNAELADDLDYNYRDDRYSFVAHISDITGGGNGLHYGCIIFIRIYEASKTQLSERGLFMYCKHCGSEIENHAKFCPDCGAAQNGAAPQQPVINVVNQNTNINKNFGYIHKRKWVAFFLCLFLGYFGAHRFYVGKIGTGIIWLFTAGFFGIGWILDLIFILFGGFRDKAGQPLA